ncbi:nucleotide exchange factor GrpE [Halomonas halocynthiae]|uniref:nucleotide exchange factor GrpE n=1 Tax=Halomonas halocynthiae TaxID=176290 RepID=UPI00042771B9|nr:nucleotide exchange factor GrpE [Halomonas halocynthiae]
MAKDSQTPLDDELARQQQDGEPQAEPEDTTTDPQDVIDAAVEAEDESLVALDESDNPEADLLAARVEELQQEVDAAKDQALRAAAEAQNVRRRAEQEAAKARKFALEKFIKELLPVVDSLEKALETLQDGSQAHREGVAMTLKMQLDVLEKCGVEVLDPHGEPFTPEFHEAVAMVPNPELDPNSVMDVVQKGYVLNGRLVRPAMVVVSQAAG